MTFISLSAFRLFIFPPSLLLLQRKRNLRRSVLCYVRESHPRLQQDGLLASLDAVGERALDLGQRRACGVSLSIFTLTFAMTRGLARRPALPRRKCESYHASYSREY